MVKLLQWCTRVAGILALILGLLIGRVSYAWIPRLHFTLGFIVIGALVLIAIAGFFAHLPPVLPLIGLLWASAALYVAIEQASLIPGDEHWIISLVHALLGIGAIGLVEATGARLKKRARL